MMQRNIKTTQFADVLLCIKQKIDHPERNVNLVNLVGRIEYIKIGYDSKPSVVWLRESHCTTHQNHRLEEAPTFDKIIIFKAKDFSDKL